MADDTVTADKPATAPAPTPAPTKPLFPAAETKPAEPVVSPSVKRLRDFEDAKLGKDVHRINGKVERGSGSFFQTKLSDPDKKHHAALEKLIEAEEKRDAAVAAAALAQQEAEEAFAAAELEIKNSPPDKPEPKPDAKH